MLFIGVGVLGLTFLEDGWQGPSSPCCVEEGFEKLNKALEPRELQS